MPWLAASLLLLAVGPWASARASNPPGLDMETLCRFMAENIKVTGSDSEAALYEYVYRRDLFRAAGVDPRQDDKARTRLKMQAYWNRHRQAMTCNIPHSFVRDGNILKLAVDRSNTNFLQDAIYRWELDLNLVDRDGTTLLDFLDSELARDKGTPRADTLNRYRTMVLAHGGKRARELRSTN